VGRKRGKVIVRKMISQNDETCSELPPDIALVSGQDGSTRYRNILSGTERPGEQLWKAAPYRTETMLEEEEEEE
jgi:hypothetical protein